MQDLMQNYAGNCKIKATVLSGRLQAAVNMVTPGNRVCDVGCDHGFTSIYLVEQGISPYVIAMDINPGPLGRAADHIAARNLSVYIETRLSDGLSDLAVGEAETLILAGMGGPLIRKILTADRSKTQSVKEIILQPQSKVAEFRRFLREAGYGIIDEEMVREEQKFYPLIKVVPLMATASSLAKTAIVHGENRFESNAKLENNAKLESNESIERNKSLEGNAKLEGSDNLESNESLESPEAGAGGGGNVEIGDRWGRLLLAKRHPILKQYLLREEKIKEALQKKLIDNAKDKQLRFKELQQELNEIRLILNAW